MGIEKELEEGVHLMECEKLLKPLIWLRWREADQKEGVV